MKKMLLLAAAAVALTANAQDFYMIGSNVNGNSWALAEESSKFENKGNGLYEWKGEVLGTGFKINNGTWDTGAPNIGGNGYKLILGEEYTCSNDGNSGNIDIDGVAELLNPTVTLDMTDEAAPVIVVTGTENGGTAWYFTGSFNEWTLDDTFKMTGAAGVSTLKNVTMPESGELKISSTGWGEQYGTSDEVVAEITPEKLSTELGLVGGEGGGCPFTLTPGNYDVEFVMDTKTLTLTVADGSGVAGIVAEEGEAVYYNLQGVRVAEPRNGIFVKVINKKAQKVNIAK